MTRHPWGVAEEAPRLPNGNLEIAKRYTGGLYTTATDEAGNARETATDGLGRLTAVWDNPSGLNYGAQVERFTSADPENAGSDPGDPQSWNGYAYARNNSLLLVDPTGRNYTVCDQQGQNCADLTDQQWSDFRDQNGIGQQAGGQLYVTNEDGSYTNVGTATYYNEQDVQAANFLNYQVAPVINGLGYATAGVIAGAAVGAGYGAIAGGARLIGSIGVASGPAIFSSSSTMRRSRFCRYRGLATCQTI